MTYLKDAEQLLNLEFIVIFNKLLNHTQQLNAVVDRVIC